MPPNFSRRPRHCPAFAGLLLLPALAPAFAAEDALPWTGDLEAARAQASREGKDLFLYFTGGGWCIKCKKLQKEVFSDPAFLEKIPSRFVLVKVNFPGTAEVTPEVRESAHIARRYAVEGLPTIYLTDAQGRAYGRTDYREGGAAAWLAHLEELAAQKSRRDELLSRAAAARGLDRARLLHESLAALGPQVEVSGYEETIREIIALDEKNEAGLKDRYAAFVRVRAERDEAFRKAREAEGLERARALDRALDADDEAYVPLGHEETAQEIIALDPKNEAGLRMKWEARVKLGVMDAAFKRTGDFEAALKELCAWEKTYPSKGVVRQMGCRLRLWALDERYRDNLREVTRAGIESAPETEWAATEGRLLLESLETER